MECIMQTYETILASLTDAQRVHILTDIHYLTNPACRALGIPEISVGSMKDYLRELYPHATALSHAWDTELWRDVAKDKLSAMRSERVNFAIVPGARIKLSPYRKEITEDPFLASSFSACHQMSATESGVVCGASGCYLTDPDLAFLDDEPNTRVIHEYVTKPYIDSVQAGRAEAVISSGRTLWGTYERTNLSIQQEAIRDGKLFVCEWASDEMTVPCLANGGLCFHGSYVALDTALKQYRKMYKSVEEGYLTPTDLDAAVNSYTAISPETVEQALIRVLDLAFACQKHSALEDTSDTERINTAYRATLGSIVLLKNKDGALPMRSGGHVALIGDIAYGGERENSLICRCKQLLTDWGASQVSFARGYDFSTDNGAEAANGMLEIASKADTVLLFLGFGEERERTLHRVEKLTLPANQLCIADQLSRYGKKVIAIIDSGHSVDVEFTRLFSAVVVAPLGLRYSAEALLQVLTGAEDPSGRLAYTLYAGTERAFQKQRFYKRRMHMKAGPFIGYRYYDTAEMRVGYPFGHGLSYGEVEYSACTVEERDVSFTVQNLSEREVYEVVQVYAGMKSSSVLRPKKELCGFLKLRLEPCEKKRVTVKISLPTVYSNGRYVTERGIYKIEIGHSISDIRLSTEQFFRGSELAADGERLSDYLQTSSNIVDGKYTLEADYVPMKKSFKNLLFGIGAVALAISVGVFNMTSGLSADFLTWIAAILAASGVMFFIMQGRERSLAHAEARKRVEEINNAHFANAEEIRFASTQALFNEAFESDDELFEAQERQNLRPDEEYLRFVKNDFLFAQAASEFRIFAQDRGYQIEKKIVENIFASLAASRLIVLDAMETVEFRALMLLLGEYLETKTCFDTVDESYDSDFSAFFGYDESHAPVRRNLASALNVAHEAPDKIHLIALDSVDPSTLSTYFNIFVPYIKNPNARITLSVRDAEDAVLKYPILGNVWFVLNLKENRTAVELPRTLLDLSAGLRVKYEACEPSESHASVELFTYYQLRYLTDQLEKSVALPEERWKKIDKLEAFVRAHADYRIGNKLWLNMERHMMTLAACGADVEEALDESVCALLMPSVLAALNDCTNEEISVVESIDMIFGESSMPSCLAYVKSVASAAAQRELAQRANEEESSEEAAMEMPAEEEVTEEEVTEEEVAEEILSEEEAADVDSTNEN